MAVPKRKTSHQRKMKRRSQVWKLDLPALSKCTECGEYCAPHKVCKNCGFYKGKLVLKIGISAPIKDEKNQEA